MYLIYDTNNNIKLWINNYGNSYLNYIHVEINNMEVKSAKDDFIFYE